VDTLRQFFESRLGIQILMCAGGLVLAGGLATFVIMYAHAAQDPVSSAGTSSNLALRTLGSRLGLTYVESPSVVPDWVPFDYLTGRVHGYPLLVYVRCRSSQSSGNLFAHSALQIAWGALRPGVSPVALIKSVPRHPRGDPDALFSRYFAPLPLSTSTVSVPPPAARDALLDLARGADVLMVEAGGLRVVPGRGYLKLVVNPDKLADWVQRMVRAANHLGTPDGADGDQLSELLQNQYGYASLDEKLFIETSLFGRWLR